MPSCRHLLLLFATFGLASGCGKGEAVETGDVQSGPATEQKQAADEGLPTNKVVQRSAQPIDTGLDPSAEYPVPNAPPEALLKFVNQLATQRHRGSTPEEITADQAARARSRLVAVDRIILSPDADEGLKEAAVRAKLDALRMLAMVEPDGLGKNFVLFVDELKKAKSPIYAMLGRVSHFDHELDRIGYGIVDDPATLMQLLDDILAQPQAGEGEFLATQYAGEVLGRRGMRDQATEVLSKVAAHFSKSDKPELAAEAKDLLSKTEFRTTLIEALDGDKDQLRELYGKVAEQLRKKPLTLEVLDTTINAAQMLEYSGKFEAAKKVFTAIRKTYAKHDDKQLADQAVRSVEYAMKRMGVVGGEVAIEGVELDGTPFEWKSTKGKVVLIDFWATWSVPWRDELLNVRDLYQRFHDEGFEVVGVNLDEQQGAVYQYQKQHPLPWSVVIDKTVSGLGNVNAIKYGVEAVPFMMLVGRDGKVVDIHVRGEELQSRIEALLKEPAGQNAAETADTQRR